MVQGYKDNRSDSMEIDSVQWDVLSGADMHMEVKRSLAQYIATLSEGKLQKEQVDIECGESAASIYQDTALLRFTRWLGEMALKSLSGRRCSFMLNGGCFATDAFHSGFIAAPKSTYFIENEQLSFKSDKVRDYFAARYLVLQMIGDEYHKARHEIAVNQLNPKWRGVLCFMSRILNDGFFREHRERFWNAVLNGAVDLLSEYQLKLWKEMRDEQSEQLLGGGQIGNCYEMPAHLSGDTGTAVAALGKIHVYIEGRRILRSSGQVDSARDARFVSALRAFSAGSGKQDAMLEYFQSFAEHVVSVDETEHEREMLQKMPSTNALRRFCKSVTTPMDVSIDVSASKVIIRRSGHDDICLEEKAEKKDEDLRDVWLQRRLVELFSSQYKPFSPDALSLHFHCSPFWYDIKRNNIKLFNSDMVAALGGVNFLSPHATMMRHFYSNHIFLLLSFGVSHDVLRIVRFEIQQGERAKYAWHCNANVEISRYEEEEEVRKKLCKVYWVREDHTGDPLRPGEYYKTSILLNQQEMWKVLRESYKQLGTEIHYALHGFGLPGTDRRYNCYTFIKDMILMPNICEENKRSIQDATRNFVEQFFKIAWPRFGVRGQ